MKATDSHTTKEILLRTVISIKNDGNCIINTEKNLDDKNEKIIYVYMSTNFIFIFPHGVA